METLRGGGEEPIRRKMVQYVITPWRCQEELIGVRERLYGKGDVEGMRGAVELVGVWSEWCVFSFRLGGC